MRTITLEIYQRELISYFKLFNRYFVDEGIIWWTYAGTLLGAIRNEKMLAWDDDIDMAMTNIDFNNNKERIEEIAKSINFNLKVKSNTIGLVCNKLVSDETIKVVYQGREYVTKFFIDIFLYVGVKKTSKIRDYYLSIYSKIIFIFGFFWKPLPRYFIKDGNIKKINIFIIALVWVSRFFIFPILLLHYFESMRIRNNKFKDLFSLHCKESNLSDYFSYNLDKWIFEEQEIFVPSNYQQILINKFGKNYLDLPPQKCRVPSHIFNGDYEN